MRKKQKHVFSLLKKFVLLVVFLLLLLSLYIILRTNYLNFFRSSIDEFIAPLKPCTIGKILIDSTEEQCDKLQSYVQLQKQTDISSIEHIIDGINSQIQALNNQNAQTSNYLNNTQNLNNLMNGCSGNESQAYQCKLRVLTTVADVASEQTNKNNEEGLSLENEKTSYQNYIGTIINGGLGNGACSDHGGVDCSQPRGDQGQVICADGWDQSKVYYFNVKECIEYTESVLFQK